MEPTMTELEKATGARHALPSGKAPGSDAISPEVIKRGKASLIPHLHELICLCWREGQVQQTMPR